MSEGHVHQSHPEIVNRLKRASGHLQSTIKMFEDERSCTDIAQQLHAVERAIAEARKLMVKDHIDTCIGSALASLDDDARSTLDDLREIARYL